MSEASAVVLGDVLFTAAPTTASLATGFALIMNDTPQYVVDQWSVNGVPAQSGGETFTLSNVTADTAVGVTFKPAPAVSYTVTGAAGANGSIAPCGEQSVGPGAGESVTFTAMANPGYDVDQWQINGSQVQSGGVRFTVSNLTVPATVQVTFKAVADGTQTITASAVPTYGGAVSGGGVFVPRTQQTVAAAPNPGYTFVNWTENGIEVSSSRSYTFTLTTNRVLMANFTATPVTGTDRDGPAVQITQPHSSGGLTTTSSSIDVTGTASDLGRGNNGVSIVTVNGVAASGDSAGNGGTANWHITVPLNSGANTITVVAKDTFNNVTQQQITVTYNEPGPSTFTLRVETSSGSQASINVTNPDGRTTNSLTNFQQAYAAGSNVTITAPESLGDTQFLKWTLDGSDLSTNLAVTIRMDAAHTLVAVYQTTSTTPTSAKCGQGGLDNVLILGMACFVGLMASRRFARDPR